MLHILALLQGKPRLLFQCDQNNLHHNIALTGENLTLESLLKLKKKETCAAEESMEVGRVMVGQVSRHHQAPS